MLPGAAKLHRRMFERMVDAGQWVQVRQPAPVTTPSAPVDKVLGKRPAPPPAAAPVGASQPIRVLWGAGYDSNVLAQPTLPPAIAAVGRTERLDVILRCKLADALTDPSRVFDRTIFDTAHDVVFQGVSFKVVVTDRGGLPPEGPYELWVGLRKGGA